MPGSNSTVSRGSRRGRNGVPVVYLLSLVFKLMGNALRFSPRFKPVYAGGVFFCILFPFHFNGIEVQVSSNGQALLLPPPLILFLPISDI